MGTEYTRGRPAQRGQVVLLRGYSEVNEDVVEDLWQILHDKQPDTFFTHGGNLVRRQGRLLKPLKAGELGTAVKMAVTFKVTFPSRGRWKTEMKPPTKSQCDAMFAAAGSCCRSIRGVASGPFMSPAGELVRDAGYDEHSQYLLVPGRGSSKAVPAAVSEMLTVPCASKGDRAHWLGLCLLPVMRPAFHHPVPLHIITCPERPSLAALAAKAIGALVGGTPPTAVLIDSWTAESDRQLVAGVIEGGGVVLLPRVPRNLLHESKMLLKLVSCEAPFGVRPVKEKNLYHVVEAPLILATAESVDLGEATCRVAVPITITGTEKELFASEKMLRRVLEAPYPYLDALATASVDALPQLQETSHKLEGFEYWSGFVGGVAGALGVGDGWLDEEHRPIPLANADLIEVFEHWPEVNDGWLPAEAVLGEIDRLCPPHLMGLLDHTGHHGRTVALGKLLTTLAMHGGAMRGWCLERRVVDGAALYRPRSGTTG